MASILPFPLQQRVNPSPVVMTSDSVSAQMMDELLELLRWVTKLRDEYAKGVFEMEAQRHLLADESPTYSEDTVANAPDRIL